MPVEVSAGFRCALYSYDPPRSWVLRITDSIQYRRKCVGTWKFPRGIYLWSRRRAPRGMANASKVGSTFSSHSSDIRG